jgi:hypothetical protein
MDLRASVSNLNFLCATSSLPSLAPQHFSISALHLLSLPEEAGGERGDGRPLQPYRLIHQLSPLTALAEVLKC